MPIIKCNNFKNPSVRTRDTVQEFFLSQNLVLSMLISDLENKFSVYPSITITKWGLNTAIVLTRFFFFFQMPPNF